MISIILSCYCYTPIYYIMFKIASEIEFLKLKKRFFIYLLFFVFFKHHPQLLLSCSLSWIMFEIA